MPWPDATDLAVESITVQPTGTPGEDVTISYTVRNLEATPALGSWFDSVYLSRDATLDADDPLIGRVRARRRRRRPESIYTETLTAPLPAVVDADYRVIVVADSRALVPDSTAPNNTQTAAGTLRAALPVLALDQTVAGTIASGQDVYFRVDVPPANGRAADGRTLTCAGRSRFLCAVRRTCPTCRSFNAVYHTPIGLGDRRSY